MRQQPEREGWDALEAPPAVHDDDAIERVRVIKRAFGTPDGAKALAYLRSITLDCALSPMSSDAELRHLEGQRALVRRIINVVERMD